MGSYEPRGEAGIAGVSRCLVFVVEDEEDIARLISHNLQAAGFDVQSFVSGASVVSEALREMPSLFLLDVMLPGADGFDLCRQIRQTAILSATPIIFLTAKTAEADRVRGLELGGDDYITKPFSPRELTARVQAAIRRQRRPSQQDTFRFGECEVDFKKMTVLRAGQPVVLTAHEFKLLKFFTENAERVLTRDVLLNEVWGYNFYPTTRTVDNQILKLRQKLEPDPANPKHLLTIYGAGYKLVP